MKDAPLSNKEQLIFDFDKTLFTLDLPWSQYRQRTYEILEDFNQQFFNKHRDRVGSSYELVNLFTKEFGSEIRQQTLDYAKKFEQEQLASVTEHPEYTNFIDQHLDDYRFYIWSSNCLQTIETILEEYNLLDCFEKVIGRDLVQCTKPDPEGFSLITRGQQPINRGIYLMIGDSNSDKRAAAAAEIDFYRATH